MINGILNGFVNAISSPGFQNIAQNTTAQVSIETGLKAVGRPAFTLADKHVDKQTRKYSAVKELLYQVLCLGIYLAIIPPVFKRGAFKIFKSICNTANKHPEFLKEISGGKIDNCAINMFKNEKGLLAFHQLGHLNLKDRLDPTNAKAVKLFKKLEENLIKSDAAKDVINAAKTIEKDDNYFKRFYMGKGGIEMGSIAGSVVGLTLLAPELSHLILHPIMKFLNMDAPKAKDVKLKPKPEKPANADKTKDPAKKETSSDIEAKTIVEQQKVLDKKA